MVIEALVSSAYIKSLTNAFLVGFISGKLSGMREALACAKLVAACCEDLNELQSPW